MEGEKVRGKKARLREKVDGRNGDKLMMGKTENSQVRCGEKIKYWWEDTEQ